MTATKHQVLKDWLKDCPVVARSLLKSDPLGMREAVCNELANRLLEHLDAQGFTLECTTTKSSGICPKCHGELLFLDDLVVHENGSKRCPRKALTNFTAM